MVAFQGLCLGEGELCVSTVYHDNLDSTFPTFWNPLGEGLFNCSMAIPQCSKRHPLRYCFVGLM